MEGLDPAIEHLRGAGHGRHVGDRQAGVAERTGGPAGRHELESVADEAAPELDQPGLVRDGQQRPPRDGDARLGSGGVDPCRSALDPDRARGEERDRPWQQAVLDRVDPRGEAGLIVAGNDRDRLLDQDRPAVERLVDEMDRDTGHRDAVRQRVGDRMGARESRQQRGMDVEDPSAERRQHPRPDDPHVARQNDDVDTDGGQRRLERGVVATRDEGGLEPGLGRPVERRA